jgi:hypothetical protein
MGKNELSDLLAARPKRGPLRKPTDAERAQWAANHRRVEARRKQARLDVAAAVEATDRAMADLDRALLAALDAGVTGRDLQTLTGLPHATFWRRVKALKERVGKSS